MAVYREGYSILKDLLRRSVRIYPDAADFGVPVKKGSHTWIAAKQLIDMYGEHETRKSNVYSTGKSVEEEFTLMDEWAVSDERKTVAEATERYKLYYTTCTTGACKGFDGFLTIEQLS